MRARATSTIPLNLRPHPARPSRAPEQLPHPISRPSTSTPTLTHARAASTSHFPPVHLVFMPEEFHISLNLRPHPARPSRVPEKLSRTVMRRFLPFLKRESPPEFRKTSVFFILPLQNAPRKPPEDLLTSLLRTHFAARNRRERSRAAETKRPHFAALRWGTHARIVSPASPCGEE